MSEQQQQRKFARVATIGTTAARAAGRLAVLLGISAVVVPAAWATRGLSTKFAEVEVKNLKIGKTYSLQKIVNFPLRVINTGSEAAKLKVDVVPPGASEGKEGYEPIPDTGWIRLTQSTFTVFPNMQAVSDVLIAIPNDEKLLGRRFVVYLWTQSQDAGFVGVALKSRLLISVSSRKPTVDELKEKFVNRSLANLNFSFAPMEVLLDGVPVGREIRFKDFNAEMRISNPNDRSYHFHVASVGLWETAITPPAGYQVVPDPNWVSVSTPTFKADAYSFIPLDLRLKVPDSPEFRGKGFELAIRAEILEQEISAYAYGTILIKTKK